MTDFLASSDYSDSYTPSELFAGEAPVTTGVGKLASGQNLAKYAVIARITASGKYTLWAPAQTDGSQNAIGILVHATDASGGDQPIQLYTGGVFNIDALVWPGGATTAQKVRAFDGTSIATRALPGSTTVI